MSETQEFPLNARVMMDELGLEGTIISRTDYINGSSHYVVRYKKDEKELGYVSLHAPEMTLVSDDKVIEDGEPEIGLGVLVEVLPDCDIQGYVTAHSFSVSGCVEYSVTASVPLTGVKSFLLDAEVLKVAEPAFDDVPKSLEVGSQTGSVFRSPPSR